MKHNVLLCYDVPLSAKKDLMKPQGRTWPPPAPDEDNLVSRWMFA